MPDLLQASHALIEHLSYKGELFHREIDGRCETCHDDWPCPYEDLRAAIAAHEAEDAALREVFYRLCVRYSDEDECNICIECEAGVESPSDHIGGCPVVYLHRIAWRHTEEGT